MPKDLRIIFFGTPEFAIPSLKALTADSWNINLVVTAPDKPVGRQQKLTPSAVRVAAESYGIPIEMPVTLNDESFWSAFSAVRPDLCIVVAYNKIIPQRYLDIPRFGFLNVHPSLLPAYRGPSPIQTAILDGATATGVSIMVLDAEVDHGPILTQESWTIPENWDTPTCEQKLAVIGATLLARTISEYINGNLKSFPQDDAQATFTHKFTREDGRIDWSQSAERVSNQIRALAASPGTWTKQGDIIINIIQAHASQNSVSQKSGTILRYDGELAVTCGQGILMLDLLQLAGGKRMTDKDFLNGHQEYLGKELV